MVAHCFVVTVIGVDDTTRELKKADKDMKSPPEAACTLETRANDVLGIFDTIPSHVEEQCIETIADRKTLWEKQQKERENAEEEIKPKTIGMAGKQETERHNAERQIIEARKTELKRMAEEKKRSIWQEPQVYIEGLKAKTLWMAAEFEIGDHIAKIRQNWKLIRDEALAIRQLNLYWSEGENLTDTGKWEIFALYMGGVGQNCEWAPVTCSLFDSVPPEAIHPTGNVIFSTMKAGTHVRAHSGPTNTRLRAHLGLQIPEDLSPPIAPSKSYTKLRVAEQYFSWHDGEILIFDDSYDHEVWHDNLEGKPRVILAFDLWHPGLSEEAKTALSPKLQLLATK